MNQIHILNVVGARPNMMKIAPIVEAMHQQPAIRQTLLHTGQHYDEKMSQVFFDDLGIPKPDIYLGVGSGTHAEQTARVMVEFERILVREKPDAVLVVGDVNSTLACSVTAAKLWVPVAHVEAGLRSRDRKMPEEINRIVTDALSDWLFTTSRGASDNLRQEGIAEEKIFFVGNVMIDTLHKHRERAAQLQTPERYGLEAGNYALVTLHRPSNVDVPEVFRWILDALLDIQQAIPILFPIHPRTRKRIDEFGLSDQIDAAANLYLIEPQGYLAFLDLMMHARLALSDSAGVQEETTILGVPCLTIRENTERPVTVTDGTNELVGMTPDKIRAAAYTILRGEGKAGRVPELWDGHAAERIVAILSQQMGGAN